ncbi:hypothetical protein [Peribacillus loiseleuriae]|uniref:Uncharacterized protein n=1 Tax=Peribacillus loiseleuriae TaxID=1679170 RepID=A0A0K9GSG9_9BACI|nr:hypothetical protein [Peribacillus loiseleuriae]KMY49634.1 hypothetical protein AC625_08855 [Peribacillus loiseleuriae]
MKKFIIEETKLSKVAGKKVYIKADRTQTLNFDYAGVFPEIDANSMKEENDNLELIEVIVTVV